MLLVLFILPLVAGGYWRDRNRFMKRDARYALGANIHLNKVESRVNKILMRYKLEEYDRGFRDPSTFLASQHFFEAREAIERSQVFQILRKLPKGGNLHVHDKAMVSNDFLRNLTHSPNLYSCTKDKRFYLKFFEEPDDFCQWESLAELRKTNPNFDETIREKLSLVTEDYRKAYPSINEVWAKFSEIFDVVGDMLKFRPVFKTYVTRALEELYEDNVKYLEFRSSLSSLTDVGAVKTSTYETAKLYMEIVAQFKKKHPDFIGAKVIISKWRGFDENTMRYHISYAKALKARFPNFIAGYDLVGQEDLGKPLTEFIPELLNASKKINFFFHAGETNWFGSTTDLNLFDAVLLGAHRIGHAYSLPKHPALLKYTKLKDIGIEIAPISNQVLMLVDEPRDHPGNILMAYGLPVVICNDDPGMWGARGLSYDWYYAFMGMTRRSADLRVLKQLAINSLKYSAMSRGEKKIAMKKWTRSWKSFLKVILQKYKHVRLG